MSNELHLLPFDELAERFKPLIEAAVKDAVKIHHGQIEDDDLRQEALMALYNATLKYDPQKNPNVYFEAYAKTCVRNQMFVYCRQVLPFKYVRNTEGKGKSKFIIQNISVQPFGDIQDVL